MYGVRMRVFLALVLCFALASSAAAQTTPTPPPVTPQDLADPDGQFVDINGASVYYRLRGAADSPAVVLLHGFLGSTANWDDTLDILAGAGYRVLAFDRPPFGLSDKRPELDYSLEAQAALTAGLMDTLGIETAAVVGHSAGGAVAAQFALAYPARVERLALVAGAIGLGGPDDPGADGDQSAPTSRLFANADPNSPVARLALRALFTSDSARSLFSQSVEDTDLISPTVLERSAVYLQLPGWEAGLLAFTRDASLTALDPASLERVSVPTLLIWGEHDRIVPLSVGERLRQMMPHAAWISYPNVGHIPMWEISEQFHADLLAFLGQ